MTEFLTNITQTEKGYPVKELKWNPKDNIIVGQVQDPITGNEKLRDGYVTVQWRKNGKPTNFFKGREDLIIKLNYDNE